MAIVCPWRSRCRRIDEPAVVKRILLHLGLPAEPLPDGAVEVHARDVHRTRRQQHRRMPPCRSDGRGDPLVAVGLHQGGVAFARGRGRAELWKERLRSRPQRQRPRHHDGRTGPVPRRRHDRARAGKERGPCGSEPSMVGRGFGIAAHASHELLEEGCVDVAEGQLDARELRARLDVERSLSLESGSSLRGDESELLAKVDDAVEVVRAASRDDGPLQSVDFMHPDGQLTASVLAPDEREVLTLQEGGHGPDEARAGVGVGLARGVNGVDADGRARAQRIKSGS